MVGSTTTIQGAQPVEYVEESTFAQAPTDPSMSWVGLVTEAAVTVTPVEEVVRYLPDNDDAVDLQTLTAEKVSEMYNVELTYHPQDEAFYPYFLGGDGTLESDLTSVAMGFQDTNNGEYQQLLGCVGEELEITIEEDSIAEVSASFLAASSDGDWDSTDYVASGSHATENTAEPYSYDDLGSVQWGGSSIGDAIESLTVTVSNDLTVVKDPDSNLDSHIDSIVPTSREITTELALTYDDMSMVDDIRSFTKDDLGFNFPTSTSWTVNNVAFPEAPYTFGPEDLVGDSVSSVACDGLSYTTA